MFKPLILDKNRAKEAFNPYQTNGISTLTANTWHDGV